VKFLFFFEGHSVARWGTFSTLTGSTLVFAVGFVWSHQRGPYTRGSGHRRSMLSDKSNYYILFYVT
jgi:hypothetical protein